jgi:hypothetical protein
MITLGYELRNIRNNHYKKNYRIKFSYVDFQSPGMMTIADN